MEFGDLITLLGIIFTPVLGAVSALFWLVWKERALRISERDTRIQALEAAILVYRDSVTPALQATQASISSILDTQQAQGRLLEDALRRGAQQ